MTRATMDEKLRIALLVDPEIPVPPTLYGGIERIVHFLAEELHARGHRVTLFAHAASRVSCELEPWRGMRSSSHADTLANMARLAAFALRERDARLVIHSFARLAYMLPLLPTRLTTLQSYQRKITPRSVRLGHVLSRGRLQFTACSAACAATGNVTGAWQVIHNGVELDRYHFRSAVDAAAPLMFLGRIERIKGAHHALEVARQTGRPLVLAGNLPERGPDVDYARSLVAACDGRQLQYVGPVDDRQKDELLGRAAALLMPIEWDEPFGIVMAEALACGTPVIAFGRGSVPEVVRDGHDGFVCSDLAGMIAAVGRLPEIDRAACRTSAATRFSSRVIVDQYEALYRSLRARAVP